MGMFVSGRVAITATGPIDEDKITPDMNVVFIRPMMDYGTRQRVIGAAAKLIAGKSGNRKQRRANKKRGESSPVQMDVAAYQIALLVENILGWQGPSFVGYDCKQSTIEALNPKEPIIACVIQEISDRNSDEDPEDDDDDGDNDDPNVLELTATVATTA